MEREFDVLVWGVTGFTGKMVLEYLEEAYPETRVLLGGRSEASLKALRPGAALAVASLSDPKSLDAMISRVRVVIACAGPYVHYGLPIVESCVRTRTDYVDITGETAFVQQCIDRYHETAREQGLLIVPFCGVDSIPADLSVWMLHQEKQRLYPDESLQIVHSYVNGKGSISGGTARTMLEMLSDPKYIAISSDPYSINPRQGAGSAKRPGDKPLAQDVDPWTWGVWYSSLRERWVAPFIMGVINSRVVRRTAALLEAEMPHQAYGPANAPVYREFSELPHWGPGYLYLVSLALLSILGYFSWTRSILQWLLPRPGDAMQPSLEENGYLKWTALAQTDGKHMLESTMLGRAPYRATAMLVVEAALCMVDPAFERPLGGVLTPALAFSDTLVARLKKAGMELSVKEIQCDSWLE